MYDFASSRFRGLRLRLKFYQFFVKREQKHSTFIYDQHKSFDRFINNLKDKKYKKAVIIGNAPNISSLDDNTLKQYNDNDSVLTIGLNKTYLIHHTEILLWGDHVIMKDLAKTRVEIKTTFLHAAQLVKHTRDNLQYWEKNKNFIYYQQKGLFKSRTILVSALHMCYLLDIKNIELYGISLDDRSHFYDHNNILENQDTFEHLSPAVLSQKYIGYTAQKITQEIINYLALIGFELHYGGKSNFLYSVKGIKPLEKSR